MALFERITIIGLGLIGSSIARAVRKYHLAETIVGCDADEVTLTYARSKKIIDVAMHDMATAARDSKLVIIATPPLTMGRVAKAIADDLKKGAIVMDTASVKMPVMQAIGEHLPSHVDYIPAHPIAGSEHSGVRAGRTDLFEDKRVIVTPNEPLQDKMLQTINRFWSAMGARVEGVPPDMHDVLYAYVSHLPQLLAYATPAVIADAGNDAVLQRFLRLRGSKRAMWDEIFALNQDNIVKALDRYLDALLHIRDELARAPEGEASAEDDYVARHVLFPRIAASCLITTVMEAEKNAGFPYARFAGTGFADFTAPATQAPEETIEKISSHHRPVAQALQDYADELKRWREAIG